MSKLQNLYDALKEIANFQSSELLYRNSEKEYGLDYTEALEMAYENMKDIAQFAIRNMRRPKE